jgi:hypothetical protein
MKFKPRPVNNQVIDALFNEGADEWMWFVDGNCIRMKKSEFEAKYVEVKRDRSKPVKARKSKPRTAPAVDPADPGN